MDFDSNDKYLCMWQRTLCFFFLLDIGKSQLFLNKSFNTEFTDVFYLCSVKNVFALLIVMGEVAKEASSYLVNVETQACYVQNGLEDHTQYSWVRAVDRVFVQLIFLQPVLGFCLFLVCIFSALQCLSCFVISRRQSSFSF